MTSGPRSYPIPCANCGAEVTGRTFAGELVARCSRCGFTSAYTGDDAAGDDAASAFPTEPLDAAANLLRAFRVSRYNAASTSAQTRALLAALAAALD